MSNDSDMNILHWEDFEVGRTLTLGEKTVTREEIIAFASEFDPQPFHLDEAAAANTMLGGLAASGWHSCAMMMRLMCDGFLVNSSSLGSPGLKEVKWLKPVRPGDTLKAQYTCREARASKSRPGVGICELYYELLNSHGDLVMSWECTQFFGRREDDTAS